MVEAPEILNSTSRVYDLGNLYVYDPQPLKSETISEKQLKEIVTSNFNDLQSCLNKLDTEKKEDVIVLKLPPTILKLPREKRIPIDKPLTKWEIFAKNKGIKNNKKERMVFDQVTQSWKPAWGYDRANSEKTKNWLIELPDNANPYDDAFAIRKEKLANKTKKVERAQEGNIKRAKIAMGVGQSYNQISDSFSTNKEHLSKSLKEAHLSTASIGKFPYKPRHDEVFASKGNGKFSKAQKDTHMNRMLNSIAKPKKTLALGVKHEKQAQLDILQSLSNREPRLQSLDKLANVALQNASRQEKADRASLAAGPKSKSRIREHNKLKKYKIGTSSNKFAHKKKGSGDLATKIAEKRSIKKVEKAKKKKHGRGEK